MATSRLITSLDIGTDGIKALVVQKGSNSDLETLVFFKKPIVGIRRGIVVDPQAVTRALIEVREEIKAQIGRNQDSIYVNVSGSHLFCTYSQGKVAVSRADRQVSEEDIDRVIEDAKTFSLFPNKQILEVFPKNFIVDGEKVREAVGMRGVRLEVESLMVCAFSPYYENLKQSLLSAGFDGIQIIPSPIAAAQSVLSPRQKELGVALLDIGEGTSSLAVYEEGNLIHLAVLPIGSSNITYDIAIGLKIDIDVAEGIKKEFGACSLSKKEQREKIEIKEPEQLVFYRKNLAKIIEARISEIFEEVHKEIKKIGKDKLLPAGIVLVGGGAKIPGIIELAKKELNLPCTVGKPKGFIGLTKDPSLSTLCGLALMGFDLEDEGNRSSVLKDFISRIKNIFKSFIP
ncbi:MAG: cell division protein FtsA [Patescibacteria group bacterium]|nr:cell division protein FtsA [Patescibacteria group bacterium]MBU1877107.1 cell division protein FtsA [Patescibacteria group bacterium]